MTWLALFSITNIFAYQFCQTTKINNTLLCISAPQLMQWLGQCQASIWWVLIRADVPFCGVTSETGLNCLYALLLNYTPASIKHPHTHVQHARNSMFHTQMLICFQCLQNQSTTSMLNLRSSFLKQSRLTFKVCTLNMLYIHLGILKKIQSLMTKIHK